MTQTSKLRKIQIYQFKGFDMDTFVEKYLYSITPHETIDEDTISVFRAAEIKMTEAKRGAKSRLVIENKCRYLQDAIIRMANRKQDDRTFSLNAEILKSVIGKEYKTMLEVFIEMGYISMGDGKWGNGKYYYYQSDNDAIDENLLNDRYIKVIEGGYEINDLPYNSMLRLEELEAPKGYYIEEAVFYLNADIPYSEITFKNDRVNSFEILPARKMRIPKTCIGS